MVFGAADTVPGVSLAQPVGELLMQPESTAALLAGLRVVAELRVAQADGVQARCLSRAVPHSGEEGVGLLEMADRLGVPRLTFGQPGQVLLGAGFAVLVPGLAAEHQAVVKVTAGLVEVAEPDARGGEEAPADDHGRGIGKPFGCGQRGALDRGRLWPVAVCVQEGRDCPWDLPGIGIEPVGGGVLGGGGQDLALGLEPGQGLFAGGQRLGGDARTRRADSDRGAVRVEQR